MSIFILYKLIAVYVRISSTAALNKNCCKMEQVLIVSKGGKKKITNDGFVYVFDKTSMDGSTEFWRCERRSECEARIHVNGETVARG